MEYLFSSICAYLRASQGWGQGLHIPKHVLHADIVGTGIWEASTEVAVAVPAGKHRAVVFGGRSDSPSYEAAWASWLLFCLFVSPELSHLLQDLNRCYFLLHMHDKIADTKQ